MRLTTPLAFAAAAELIRLSPDSGMAESPGTVRGVVEKTTILVGAGCSYGTLRLHRSSSPPLASEFGLELTKRTRGWPSKYSELAKVADHLGKLLPNVGLEELWTRIDYHAKFMGTFSPDFNVRSAAVELKSALLHLYGRSCDKVAGALPLSAR